MIKNVLAILVMLLASVGSASHADGAPPATQPTTQPNGKVGEQIPSEDSIIKDFHSLGLLAGRTDIFRSACPVRDLAKQAAATTQPEQSIQKQADARMQHLHDLGIGTIVCFQDPADEAEPAKAREIEASIAIEKKAATSARIHFVYRPMRNAGPDSLQTMSDQAVFDWVDGVGKEIVADANTGGVMFHCSAGHDRTGLVSAYLRMKYQHWPVDQAIAEMRRLGHNWPKFSANGGESSWHEDHIRAIAKMLDASTTRP